MTCEQCKALMIDSVYNELSSESQKDFDEHVASCQTCSAQLRSIRQTLDLMNLRSRPAPDEGFLKNLWPHIENEIKRPVRTILPFRQRFSLNPAWAYGIAAVLVLGIGIYIGRLSLTKVAPEPQEKASAEVSDSLSDQALAYIERSKNILLGVVNSEDGSAALVHQQKASRELLQKSYFLKAALNEPDQQRLRQLILDLEVILLELANVSVAPGTPAVELVRQGVDQKSILLKINIEEMRAAAHRKKNPKSAL